ncbi:glycoside hydrolase [Asticcacaulis sp. AC460]|uniref:glycosyl hydrolase n=1 Tax=Asticcacaulis sp. AC460 TaxID=1282360 RepID=UPI0003C3FDCC|nr:glycosyl hydrolase [Asticcacaulis sp. AC460]ESQ86672.1 glycoside hydrolase [Asticcacaulis sp. AC460]
MSSRFAALLLAASCLVSPLAVHADTLSDGFTNPPQSARPRVWWHWMNGNITQEGIAKDLEWMSKTGIGGLQNFDAALITPQVVDKRLVYMTPEWNQAFRYAAQTADSLNLEFGIAASPGWSETGGPWVEAKDGMKKLVWSETVVDGGRKQTLQLPPVPTMTGAFQDIPKAADIMGPPPDPASLKKAGGEIAVYAVPVAAPVAAVTVAPAIGADLATPTAETPVIVTMDYAAPQTIRSATVFFPGVASTFDKAPFLPVLEASDDGTTWRKIADIPLSQVPSTAGFAPVRAAHFRLVITAAPKAFNPAFAPLPGADLGPFASFGKPAGLRLAQLNLSGDAAVNQFEAKAGFATVDDYYALDAGLDPAESGIDPKSVIDLTAKVKPDGTLDWTPPKGRWKIVRLGWSLTGTENHPATPEATGLEVDKYDGVAVRAYLETYLSKYKTAAGSDLVGAKGVRAIVTDSIEVGSSNWTPNLPAHFKRLRGYDLTPWLPALTGAIIGDRARTDAFLYDYRRTLADLMAEQHYGTVATVAHEHGLTVYGEALESIRVTLGDDMAMRRHADVPMSAMWTYRPQSGPDLTAVADMKGAASVAHIYGQNLVAAESLTAAFSPWAFAPSDLRPMIDLEFASGVNRPVIHTSVHQPLGDDKKPGLSLMIFGQYFNRNETWAGMARPWVDYIARNAYLLQQGRNHADVAYFYGEEAPLVTLFHGRAVPDAPVRYAYDFVNPDVLLNQLTVQNGDLVAKSGARYRILYLGGTSSRMTLPTLKRIAELADAGATIVGEAPVASPALSDDPAEFKALVARLWNGKVISGRAVEPALASIGVTPDFEADGQILFVHRKTEDGDLYFVNNRATAPVKTEARFRVTGKTPQIWRADTGQAEPISYRIEGDVTVVPLDFAAQDSFFVVFREAATAASATIKAPTWTPLKTIDGPWQIAFDGLAAPKSISANLGSLSDSADPTVKYFSGTTTYRKTVTLTKPTTSLWLDLGQVGDVAEVFVNGKPAGIAWKAPYRLDIGGLVTKGDNVIEIRVANLWVNRLIGDAQPDAQKVTFTAAPTYTPDAPLRPSGLIGPVTLITKQ